MDKTRLAEQHRNISSEELLVTQNADYPSSGTCWARLGDVMPDARAFKERAGKSRAVRTLRSLPADFTAVATPSRRRLPPGGVMWCASWAESWRPCEPPALFRGEAQEAGSAAVAYTDGSTGGDRHKPSGCSAVSPAGVGGDTQGLTHGFAVTTMGSNYVAEGVGILLAITATPAGQDIRAHTDCESLIHAINAGRERDPLTDEFTNRFYTSRRRRILNAARPVLNAIRAAVEARRGRVDLKHVKAHTGAADVHSRMNAAADREANRVRVAASHNPALIPPSGFAGEERVSLMLRGWATTGSYRKSLAHEAASQTWDRMSKAGNGHQNALAARYPASLKRYSAIVRRSKDPELARFAMLAVVRWLPCEENLGRKHRSTGWARGVVCKLCGRAPESAYHALCWCSARHAWGPRRVARDRMLAELMANENPRRSPPTVFGPGTPVRAWFDPTGNTTFEVCPRVPRRAIEQIEEMDTYAGFIGLLPPGLADVICWQRAGGGWRKLSLAETQDRMDRIQKCAVWGALRLWQARCRSMDEWYRSGEAAKFRAEARARRARKTAACAGRVSAGGRRPARARRERPPPICAQEPTPGTLCRGQDAQIGARVGLLCAPETGRDLRRAGTARVSRGPGEVGAPPAPLVLARSW